MKKNTYVVKKKILSMITLCLCVFILFGCGNRLVAPTSLSCHTEKQQSALSDGYANFNKYATGTKEWSAPEPIRLSWEYKGSEGIMYTVIISENEDVTSGDPVVKAETTEAFYDVVNLELGKKYYWTVIATEVSGKAFGFPAQSFTVDAQAPRNLFIDGVTNVRDIGGWELGDGAFVKQNMVIRSAKLNDNGKDKILITQNGIDTLNNDFHIKTELDLRENEIRTSSALGDSVNYVNIPIPGRIVERIGEYEEDLKQIISVFAVEDNYPILVHCSVGTDRTGLVTFLINGLLGVSEDDLYTDYAFSNFGRISSLRTYEEIRDGYVAVIKEQPGSSLKEQIENYLIHIGISKEEIAEIRRILTEKR